VRGERGVEEQLSSKAFSGSRRSLYHKVSLPQGEGEAPAGGGKPQLPEGDVPLTTVKVPTNSLMLFLGLSANTEPLTLKRV
jgi:hypothetical protein